MHFELERIVPTGNIILPFVWVTGNEHAKFERKVRRHPTVRDLEILDMVDDNGLYRIEWKGEPTDLIEAFAKTDAVVLESRGNELWTFRLRFPHHDKLSDFHNFIIEHGISLHIDRTYTLAEASDRGFRFNLSQEQREALLLALKRGYFETPSDVSLEELAEELDISAQAMSNRIRRGNERVLSATLLSSISDFE